MWTDDAQDRIYTAVKVRSEKILKPTYPKIRYTQDDSAQIDAQFPTVYVRYLPGRELANTMEADVVNAFQCDVEVQTTVSKGQGKTVAFKVANAVADEFKKYRFNFRMIPTLTPTGNDTKHVIFRMSRVIAIDDDI
jgi:hypothetical protein